MLSSRCYICLTWPSGGTFLFFLYDEASGHLIQDE